MYFDWSVLLLIFFLFRNSESAIFVGMFLVHASSGGRFVCMVVAVWWPFLGTCLDFLYVKVTHKVCFMSGNSFFVSCIILAIVYEHFLVSNTLYCCFFTTSLFI